MRIYVDINGRLNLDKLPQEAGVYRYYDVNDELLYVGKAINLYNRVKSYFRSQGSLSPRVRLFVQQIHYIELTVTHDENSALLLEKQFIIQLQPKYNILLKHDTTTPGVAISYHQFPSCYYYRGIKSEVKNADYFPLQNSAQAINLINIIQKIYKLRNCSDIVFKQQKPCLLYQINRCSAPCANKINEQEYKEQVKNAKKLLFGNHKIVVKELKKMMISAAENLEFDQAAGYRDQIQTLESSSANLMFNNLESITADIIVYKNYGTHMYYLISLVEGKYVADRSFVFDSNLNDQSVHKVFLEEYYMNYFTGTEQELKADSIMYFSEFEMLDQEAIDFFNKKLQISIRSINSCDRISGLVSMGINNLNLIIESKG